MYLVVHLLHPFAVCFPALAKWNSVYALRLGSNTGVKIYSKNIEVSEEPFLFCVCLWSLNETINKNLILFIYHVHKQSHNEKMSQTDIHKRFDVYINYLSESCLGVSKMRILLSHETKSRFRWYGKDTGLATRTYWDGHRMISCIQVRLLNRPKFIT